MDPSDTKIIEKSLFISFPPSLPTTQKFFFSSYLSLFLFLFFFFFLSLSLPLSLARSLYQVVQKIYSQGQFNS